MFRAPIIQNDLFEGVMGLAEFLEYQKTLSLKDRENVVLISITEPDSDNYVSDNPINTTGFHDVYEAKFWDVEEQIANYLPLTEEQGIELRKFIIKNKSKKFLIHCKAGMSRSAGVAKAVECIVNYQNDVYAYRTSKSEIDAFHRYSPNQTVFDKIVNI
jgi:predicted protein tyrosine phosphatase